MKDLLKKYPVMVLFAAFIMLFSAADLLTADREYSEMENKFLAQSPALSVGALLDSSEKGFAQKYESYTNEQFLLRDQWISLKSISEAVLLKAENNGIVFGSGGFMFDKVTSLDAERVARNLEVLAQFGSSHSEFKKTLVVAPSAYAVMPQRLPQGLAMVDQQQGLQQMAAQLAESGWDYVDVFAAMTNAETSPEQLYYRTDHHWTTRGAHAAYQAVAAQNELTAVGYQPLVASKKFLGTHYSKAKKVMTTPDVIEYCPQPIDSVTIDGKTVNGMYDVAKLDVRDQYAMFLYGNNAVTVLKNRAAETGQTVLILKDSYANCFVPFLTQNYETVVVVDLRSLTQPLSQLLEETAPDEVMLVYNYKNLVTDSDIPRMKY